jgi:uncharacterized membrane protein
MFALWKESNLMLILSLIFAVLFYKLSKNWIYFAKDWIRNSLVAFLLLLIALLIETPYVAFAISASYLGAAFIQIYIDEMCRSSED